MAVLFKMYRFINNTSLDVAAGAVICALFFAKVLDVSLLPQGIVALGLSVWIIYTADHLLDARKIKQRASTERHRFHQQNFYVLLSALIIAVVLNGGIIFYLREAVFKAGILLGCLVVFYLIIHQWLRFMKEIAGALFYTAGVVLPSLSVVSFNVDKINLLLITQFMCTALINLLLFSWFDHAHDKQDLHASFTTSLGERFTKILVGILFMVCLIITGYQVLVLFNWSVLIVALMDLALFMLVIFKNYFSARDRYRFFGDAVFLFPLTYLLIL